jgi:hypothetical protein
MQLYKGKQNIGQLEKRKGGYYFIKLDAVVVDKFPKKRSTRLLCTLDKKITFACGLNHLGDGNFFIIIATKNLQAIQKKLGDAVSYSIDEDPNPLGVEMPEVLQAVLEQEEGLKDIFEQLTLGKKRNIIHQLIKIKDIDKQISKVSTLIVDGTKPRVKRAL